MNADQARQLMLVRAFEVGPPNEAADATSADATLWSTDDTAWANSEALQVVGESSTPEQWLQQRAALACERLVQRQPKLARLLQPDAVAWIWTTAALLLLALVAGLLSDVIGPAGRINILAPPLLALMAWNLFVYATLLVHAVAGGLPGQNGSAESDIKLTSGGWPNRVGRALLQRFAAQRGARIGSAQASAFDSAWFRASQPLQLARLANLLHLAAIAVAAGALIALYMRGLVFEFRAGWDSTFLSADAVHGWLRAVLAPALAISGLTLPDPTQLEALRFSRGGAENAARWIHLYAITVALVMAPRLLLAVLAIHRRRALQRHFPLPLDDRYFRRLLQWLAHSRDQTAHLAVVVPYSYRAAEDLQAPLAMVIDAEFGPGLELKMLPNMAQGAEDELPENWPHSLLDDAGADLLLPLFSLSATPERETHGDFLITVLARAPTLAGKPKCRVIIDESGFRRRLAAETLNTRLQERRAAWQKMLDACQAGPAMFVDLAKQPGSKNS